MPSPYIEDIMRGFTTRQEKLRVELEQLEASARRLRQPPANGNSPSARICDVKSVIAALTAAVKVLSEDQMMVERSSQNSVEAVQRTFMSRAANAGDATHGRIQGSHVLDPAE